MAWTVTLDSKSISVDGSKILVGVTITDTDTGKGYQYSFDIAGDDPDVTLRAKQKVQREVNRLSGAKDNLGDLPTEGSSFNFTVDESKTLEEQAEEDFKIANRKWIAAKRAVELGYITEQDAIYTAAESDAKSKFDPKHWKHLYEDR